MITNRNDLTTAKQLLDNLDQINAAIASIGTGTINAGGMPLLILGQLPGLGVGVLAEDMPQSTITVIKIAGVDVDVSNVLAFLQALQANLTASLLSMGVVV
jgi:hypothetical protein